MSRDWIKVRRGWYEGLSHRHIGGDALHLGPCLMMLADASWESGDREGALVHPGNGKPLTLAQLAREARWTKARTKKALAELVEVVTLDRREDGAWVFPNYGEHQETPDARRMRAKRKAERDANEAANSSGQRSRTKEQRKNRTEGEGEQREPPPPLTYPGENPARALERQVAGILEQRGIPHNPSAYVFTDAVRAVSNGDYTPEQLGEVLDAFDAGKRPPGVERLRLFQHRHRAAVRRVCLGLDPGPGGDDLPVYTGKAARA